MNSSAETASSLEQSDNPLTKSAAKPSKDVRKEKSFKEFLKSMIEANRAFKLDSTNNTSDKLNKFSNLFNVEKERVSPDYIAQIKKEISSKHMSESQKSSQSSEGKLGHSFSGASRAADILGSEGGSKGGKRRRSIKRKHRSIRTIL